MDWKEALSQIQGLPEGDPDVNVDNEEVASKPVVKDTLCIVVDKKGRKGKVATIVEGFTIPDDEVAAIAASLKRQLGVGGSSRGGEILIQGDHTARLRTLLISLGYKVKR